MVTVPIFNEHHRVLAEMSAGGRVRIFVHNPIETVANELGSSYNPTDKLVQMTKTKKNERIVVSALWARTNFGKLLQRVESERRSLVIEKRGAPRAILLSIRDYVRLATPEPEVLTIIGEESKAKGTDALSLQQIDNIIKAARGKKTKRR
jgi:prevent-host-death family protein